MATKSVPLGNLAEVAERLATARKQLKLTQGKVAAKLRVNQATISDIERGRVEPSPGVLVRLASIYGVTLDWILTGATGPKENGKDYKPPQGYGLIRLPFGDRREVTRAEIELLEKALDVLRAESPVHDYSTSLEQIIKLHWDGVTQKLVNLREGSKPVTDEDDIITYEAEESVLLTLPNLELYEEGTPEYAAAEFYLAWSANDWEKVSQLRTLTDQSESPGLPSWLRSSMELIEPMAADIQLVTLKRPGPNSSVKTPVFGIVKSRLRFSRNGEDWLNRSINFNVMKESAPHTPSDDGTWGIIQGSLGNW